MEIKEDLLADNGIKIEVAAVDLAKMQEFSCEDEFMELSVRLLVETASYVGVAACTYGKSASWDRDHAAIGGNLVRLYKLLHGLLDQLCQRRGELAFLLVRPIFESIINIRFLIEEFSPHTVDSYIKVSLRHERKLRDSIRNNIAERGGIILPIEDRMFQSIERTARIAGLPLDSVDMNGPRDWAGKNIYEKAKAVGLEHAYLAAVGGGDQTASMGTGKKLPETTWSGRRRPEHSNPTWSGRRRGHRYP